MCGVIGTVAKNNVNQDIYDALTAMQHRGQDAAGIMTSKDSKIALRKSNGLVRDALHAKHMLRLQGNMGIGHVRYPTAGSGSAAEAQPFYVNSPYGLAIAHNGNLINAEELTKNILEADLRHLNTHSDSEVLLNVFAHELQRLGKINLQPEDIFTAIKAVHRRCIGAYVCVILIANFGIVGFRDPYGIRPAVWGKRESELGAEYMIASESVALDALGYTLQDDIQPGEAVFISQNGELFREQCASKPILSPCLFEYIYLARPDSIVDGVYVHQIRTMMGELLAKKIMQKIPDHDIDVVIPIPDTSRTAALPLAAMLGVKYTEGFVKNRYVGRTFIMPGQTQRRKSVRQKLNPISLEFKNKNVLLVDDSIVRGTTSKEIIQMARDAGAKKVYFASAAPEVKFPNVYGIDMPTTDELIAHDKTPSEIAEIIGADWVIFQDLKDLYDAVHICNPKITHLEDSIFTGKYITGGVDEAYLDKLHGLRSDKAKSGSTTVNGQIVEIYNEV
ncbi:MAG: amidophosphoribosyltransferase [Gammaproteobacteria bacterium]|nr:amidophosphoribosyltransferase [Gammaproteobacteria bacterium]